MRSFRPLWLAAALIVVCASPTFSQQVSEKQDLAVFALATYNASVPDQVLGSVDAATQEVFIGLGRFNVIGMTYRLGTGDVEEFIAKIKELKGENAVIPESVQMGKEFFTSADLNRIIGSFIVVIPSVTFYAVEGGTSTSSTTTTTTTTQQGTRSPSSVSSTSRTRTTVQRDTTGRYHVRLQASFTFVNVAETRAIAQVNIETDGYDDDRTNAGKEAVDLIPAQLTYEVRKIEEFKLKTGIIEVQGATLIMELGRDLGVKVGDEFEILGSRVLSSGKTLTVRTGLVVIREVSDEVSIARVIYASPKPQVGDQLKEFPLFGVTLLPYAELVLGPVLGSKAVFLPGVRAVVNRGLYRFKPQFGVEIPLGIGGSVISGGGALPLNLYAGGQMDVYLGRLQFNPMVSLGVGGAIPLNSSTNFALSHLGFKVGVNATLLVADKLKLSVDGGFTYWFSVGVFSNDYYGPYLGAGVELKL